MKNNNYWINRANERMVSYIDDADKVSDEIARAYYRASEQLKTDAAKIFGKFQIDGGLTEAQARALLNKIPNADLNSSLRALINMLPADARRDALNAVNAPAYAARIRNLEQLQRDIDIRINQLAQFQYEKSTDFFIDATNNAYNRTLFDLQKGTGYAFQTSGMPKKALEEILKQNWSGAHYSQRIWANTGDLSGQLKRELLSGFLSGSSSAKMSKTLQERFGVGAFEARRLVRTETNYMANQAEQQSYKESGIDQYEFLATLDSNTSTICQELDGKRFDVDKSTPGENCPPMHPNCRSTTIAVIGDEELEGLKRRARDPITGETYTVPTDMNYADWKKKYVAGNPAAENAVKKIKNKASDKKQFAQYKDVLGAKNLPKSFDNFQNLKYNSPESMQFIQLDYSRQKKLIDHPELKLPNADNVSAADEKFSAYLFGGDNSDGIAKGNAFASRLGYDSANYKELKNEILSKAGYYPSMQIKETVFGFQYEQKMVLYGLKDKPANVIVGWLVNDKITKLVTTFIKEVK